MEALAGEDAGVGVLESDLCGVNGRLGVVGAKPAARAAICRPDIASAGFAHPAPARGVFSLIN